MHAKISGRGAPARSLAGQKLMSREGGLVVVLQWLAMAAVWENRVNPPPRAVIVTPWPQFWFVRSLEKLYSLAEVAGLSCGTKKAVAT